MKTTRRNFIKLIIASSGCLVLPLSSVFALPVEQKLLKPFNPNVRLRKGCKIMDVKGQERRQIHSCFDALQEWAKDYIPRKYWKKVKFTAEKQNRGTTLAVILDYDPGSLRGGYYGLF